MSQFLETIKINNGRRINLEGHNRRMNFTRNRHFHEIRDLDLKELIHVPKDCKKGIVKCRLTYGRKIEKIEFIPYTFKQAFTFAIIEDNNISYDYKYTNRKELDELFNKKESADDIIIVKDGLVTDSYYANLAFYKEGLWYTPKSPLLVGTQRSKLIGNGTIIEKEIRREDLFDYEYLKIYNAMTEWGLCSILRIKDAIVNS